MKKALLAAEKEYVRHAAAEFLSLQRTLGLTASQHLAGWVSIGQVFFMLRAAKSTLNRQDDARSPERPDADDRERRELGPPTPLLDILEETRRVVIAGEPGAGKTTSLLYLGSRLAWQYGSAARDSDILDLVPGFDGEDSPQTVAACQIPMFFQLKSLAGALKESGGLRAAILGQVKEALVGPVRDAEGVAEELVAAWLQDNRLWLLLDGLDEVPSADRSDLVHALRVELDSNRGWPVALTSRQAGDLYRPLVAHDGAARQTGDLDLFLLQSLSRRQDQLAFAARWLEAHGRQDAGQKAGELLDWARAGGGLQKMCANPLLLHMLTEIFAGNGCVTDGLPATRSLAYERYLERVLWARAVENAAPPLSYAEAGRLLEFIAWFTHKGQRDLRMEELQQLLPAQVAGGPDLELALKFFSESLRLLVRYYSSTGDGPPGWRFAFAHRTFQEFFVARRLVALWRERKDGPKWVKKNVLDHVWWRDDWREVILLMGGAIGAEIRNSKSPSGGERLLLWALDKPHIGRGRIGAAMLGEGVAPGSPLATFLFLNCFYDNDMASLQVTGHRFVRELTQRLHHENPDIRDRAVNALQRIGDVSVVPELLKLLADEDEIVAHSCLRALCEIGDSSAVPTLVDLMQVGGRLAEMAAITLGRIGGAMAVPPLLDRLTDGDEYVRSGVLMALGEIGDSAAVPALLEQLQADDHSDAIVRTLGQIGDASAVSTLLHLLNDKDTNVSFLADVLKQFANATLLADLLEFLQGEHVEGRAKAAKVLGRIGDVAAVPALLERLADKDSRVRQNATEALGLLGSIAALPALLERLCHDQEWKVRSGAAWALGEIGDISIVPILLTRLGEEDPRVHRSVAKVLGKVGDASVVTALLEHLMDDDEHMRVAVAEALGHIGDVAAVPALLEVLNDDNKWVRQTTITALGQIGDVAAVPALLELLSNDKSELLATIAALRQIGDASAHTALLEHFMDDREHVRVAVAEALGRMGDVAAVPALVRRLKDDNKWHVRQATAAALGRLIPTPRLPQPYLPPSWTNRLSDAASVVGSLLASLARFGFIAAAIILGGLLLRFITPELIAQVWPQVAGWVTSHILWAIAIAIALAALVDWLRKRMK